MYYPLDATSYYVNYLFEEDATVCRYVVTCVRKYFVTSGQIGTCINAISVSAYCKRQTIICALAVVRHDTLNNVNIFYDEIMGEIVCYCGIYFSVVLPCVYWSGDVTGT